jgi:selenocysteine-specific translation elongation factor
LGVVLSLAHGCGEKSVPDRQTHFKLRVDDVFYVEKGGRVIVVGFVSSGSVKPGDRLTVHGGSASVPVTVERLEHPERSMSVAREGDQVGLMLHGIGKEQVQAGDWVESR